MRHEKTSICMRQHQYNVTYCSSSNLNLYIFIVNDYIYKHSIDMCKSQAAVANRMQAIITTYVAEWVNAMLTFSLCIYT